MLRAWYGLNQSGTGWTKMWLDSGVREFDSGVGELYISSNFAS